MKQVRQLFSVFLVALMLLGMVALPADAADSGYKLAILKVQKMDGTTYDPDTSMEITATNPVRAGEIVVLTIGFRNTSGSAVRISGFSAKVLYDKDKVSKYTGTAPFKNNPYQNSKELTMDYEWSMAGNGKGDGFVSTSGGSSNPYTVDNNAEVVFSRMAFTVKADIAEGNAVFSFDGDRTKSNITASSGKTLDLEAFQTWRLTIGNAPDNPGDTSHTPDNPNNPGTPNTPDTPDDPGETSQQLFISKAQIWDTSEAFDPDASGTTSANPGDVVVLTIGAKNNGERGTVDISGFAAKVLYDKEKVTAYKGKAPFKNNPYQNSTELTTDYEWSMTGNGREDGFISVAGGGSNPYSIAAGETLILSRMAFRVNADASGVAAFTFDADQTKSNITASSGKTLDLEAFQTWRLTIGNAPDNPGDTSHTPDNPNNPGTPNTPDTPDDPGETSQQLFISKAQIWDTSEAFDPNAPGTTSANPGDVVVLTIGAKNNSERGTVAIYGFAAKVLYDKEKVETYKGKAPFKNNPYQNSTELTTDYEWSMTGNGREDGFISVAGGGSNPYSIAAEETLVLSRMAFRVNADAFGAAVFSFDTDKSKTNLIASGGTLPLDTLQAFNLGVGEPKTITFHPNGGTVSPDTKTLWEGDAYGEMPVPVRDGYTFKGWHTDTDNGTKISSDDSFTLNSDQTLYAVWAKTYTITFHPNGGTVSQNTKTLVEGDTYGEMPLPVRNGYTFEGWHTATDYGTKINADDKFTLNSDQTLYAVWTKIVERYTVRFEGNGGTVSPNTITVATDSAYGELPVPKRAGCNFLGWFTEPSGGTQILPETDVELTGNQILYAHWIATDTPELFVNGEAVTDAGQISSDTELDGSLIVADVENPDEFRTATAFCTLYDEDGTMIHLQIWNVDVSDPRNICFMGNVRIPEGVTVSTIKVMILSDDLVPLKGLSTLEI